MSMKFLKQIDLFSSLSSDELAFLSTLIKSCAASKGTEIITQDEYANGLYLIEKGKIATYMLLPGGVEVELAELSGIEFVGEMALLCHETVIASVRTLTECEYLMLSCDQFDALCITQPDIAYKIAQKIAEVTSQRIRFRIGNIKNLLKKDDKQSLYRGFAANLPKKVTSLTSVKNQPQAKDLQSLSFFYHFSLDEIEEFLSYCTTRYVRGRQMLKNQNGTSDSFYIILFGAVQQVVEYKKVNSKLAVKGPGETVGQISFLDNQGCVVSAFVREQATLCEFERSKAEALERNNPLLWYKIYHQLVLEQLIMMRLADIQLVRLATETIKNLDPQKFNKLITARRD